MYGLSPNKSPEKRNLDGPDADVKRQKCAATPEAPDETLTPKSSPVDADKHARQRLKKEQEEERRLKREQEAAERKLRKEREEQEKRMRREKLEAERQARKEQKEREKLERQQKREAEARAREAKRQQEEEERARRRAEQEERALKKAEAELEKLRAKELEQQKLQKQSIMNFFKPKDTKSPTRSHPTPEKAAASDYHTYFLPFNVRPGVRMAQRTPQSTTQQRAELDKFFLGQQASSAPFEDSLASKKSAGLYAKASDVIQTYNMGMLKEAQEQLDRVPVKYLRFYENARPPYLGTYSFLVTNLDFRLALDPFTKIPSDILPINYDFDSDLEEEDDDEEGEDVELDEDSEEDEDGQLDESSDIEQFVETDENGVSTKRTVIGPLVPVVGWLGQKAGEQDQFAQYFSGLQYERLRHNIELPIDPMCDYWGEEDPQEPQSATKIIEDTRTSAGAVEAGPMTVKKKIITDAAHVAKLASFIAENSDFSINTMTEIAQKQILADYSRAVVKNSIKELATFDKKTNRWAVKQCV
ncbi:hypothetical protein KL911_001295 [Ogataea haglerorum]|uniref:uncharacterized protein n=1 Tax=Ogataea haglerorum TaxID=1937702 RepID=UPI001C891293|nr:uncharacterized protein KL911_001295 [Ogataea haglerorum]KAG7702057.1 hypothetical protein KL951_000513 [Ogataea haglerorum]KAG7751323.1 hypothetical protein KL912_000456 [Ogataea haglerorum]KAG7756493.1 hypothetical protein KL911_001295 [Ogataea haglerorum]